MAFSLAPHFLGFLFFSRHLRVRERGLRERIQVPSSPAHGAQLGRGWGTASSLWAFGQGLLVGLPEGGWNKTTCSVYRTLVQVPLIHLLGTLRLGSRGLSSFSASCSGEELGDMGWKGVSPLNPQGCHVFSTLHFYFFIFISQKFFPLNIESS